MNSCRTVGVLSIIYYFFSKWTGNNSALYLKLIVTDSFSWSLIFLKEVSQSSGYPQRKFGWQNHQIALHIPLQNLHKLLLCHPQLNSTGHSDWCQTAGIALYIPFFFSQTELLMFYSNYYCFFGPFQFKTLKTETLARV